MGAFFQSEKGGRYICRRHIHDKFGKDGIQKITGAYQGSDSEERVFIGSVKVPIGYFLTINRFVCHKAELIK